MPTCLKSTVKFFAVSRRPLLSALSFIQNFRFTDGGPVSTTSVNRGSTVPVAISNAHKNTPCIYIDIYVIREKVYLQRYAILKTDINLETNFFKNKKTRNINDTEI